MNFSGDFLRPALFRHRAKVLRPQAQPASHNPNSPFGPLTRALNRGLNHFSSQHEPTPHPPPGALPVSARQTEAALVEPRAANAQNPDQGIPPRFAVGSKPLTAIPFPKAIRPSMPSTAIPFPPSSRDNFRSAYLALRSTVPANVAGFPHRRRPKF